MAVALWPFLIQEVRHGQLNSGLWWFLSQVPLNWDDGDEHVVFLFIAHIKVNGHSYCEDDGLINMMHLNLLSFIFSSVAYSWSCFCSGDLESLFHWTHWVTRGHRGAEVDRLHIPQSKMSFSKKLCFYFLFVCISFSSV